MFSQQREDHYSCPTTRVHRKLFQHQFMKTKLCMAFKKGLCDEGDACCFAHGPRELAPSPDLRKTSLCKAFQEGQCVYVRWQCPFAHGVADLCVTEVQGSIAAGTKWRSACEGHESAVGTTRQLYLSQLLDDDQVSKGGVYSEDGMPRHEQRLPQTFKQAAAAAAAAAAAFATVAAPNGSPATGAPSHAFSGLCGLDQHGHLNLGAAASMQQLPQQMPQQLPQQQQRQLQQQQQQQQQQQLQQLQQQQQQLLQQQL